MAEKQRLELHYSCLAPSMKKIDSRTSWKPFALFSPRQSKYITQKQMAIDSKIKEAFTFTKVPGCGMTYALEKDKNYQAFMSCYRNLSPDEATLRYWKDTNFLDLSEYVQNHMNCFFVTISM